MKNPTYTIISPYRSIWHTTYLGKYTGTVQVRDPDQFDDSGAELKLVKWQHIVSKVSLTFWFFDVDILLTS